jgi:hypothetical protein
VILDPNRDVRAEWHPGPPIGHGFPEEIHVAACIHCGLRAGQEWRECLDQFQHDMTTRVYRRAWPVED